MIKGRKVYDPLTDTWSTGYWVVDDKGNYYPVLGNCETSSQS